MYACHGGCVLNETAIAIRHAQAIVAKQQAAATRAGSGAGGSASKSGGNKRKRAKAAAAAAAASSPGFGGGCRIAVVDVDVHFGDGTALNFYDDPSVLHVSIHLDQSDRQMFPFLVGKAEERGIGPGRGE